MSWTSLTGFLRGVRHKADTTEQRLLEEQG